jgi:hypothetical protein
MTQRIKSASSIEADANPACSLTECSLATFENVTDCLPNCGVLQTARHITDGW